MEIRNIGIIATLASLITMSGCSLVPVMQVDDPRYEKMTTFAPSETKGVLYVYRDLNSDYGAHEFYLQIDGTNYSTSSKCYTRFEFNPGQYHLEADHPDPMGFEQEIDITLTAQEVKFLEFKPIERWVIPGESKLIETENSGAIAKIQSQKLCPAEFYVLND